MAAGGVVLGTAIGLQFGQRVYSSIGLVRIASVLPQVMHETDQNRPIAMFDGFIQAQRDVMLSRDVIQEAMQEETWRRVERTGRAPSETQFAANLKVETRPRSDHLKVIFTDKDPSIAAAAVQSIVAAFQRVYVTEQDRVDSQRLEELKTRRAALAADLQKLEQDLSPDAKGHTVAELELAYAAAAECDKKLQTALVDVQCAIAGVPDLNERPATAERSPREIVADELIHAYTDAKTRAESDLAAAKRAGLGEKNPRLIQLKAAVIDAQQKLDQQLHESELLRSNRTAGPSPVSLNEREANLRRLAESTEQEMSRIAARRLQLTVFESQSKSMQSDLKETDARLDAIATEASVGSRLTVISDGDKPLTPSLDNRAKTATTGGFLGCAIPLALLILQSYARRRYLFGDELAADLSQRVPFVALVPQVTAGAPLNAAASHCVHELRTLLQPENQEQCKTYLVTSVSPGEGSTSMALSLGLSCASAGLRTLVVDCNLNSRRLTNEFHADSSAGLLEALAGDQPVIHEAQAGLFFLAAGHAGSRASLRMTGSAVSRVLSEQHEFFDVILIDGDPILTGAASPVVVPHVDGVLLTVARGQEKNSIESAMQQTEKLRGTIVGVVFNRAAETDFPAAMRERKSSYGKSETELPDRLRRFGPLVGNVLASLSFSHETDLDLIPEQPKATWAGTKAAA